jgi:hypothetical protein
MSNVCKCYRGGNAKGGCQLPIYSDREWPIEAYDGDLDEDLGRFTSNAAAERIIGDLSSASKMPGPTYNLPSSACPMGSRLSKIKGTTCFGCLAADTVEWRKKMAEARGVPFKLNRFITPPVNHADRWRLIRLRHQRWVPAFVFVLRNRNHGCSEPWFRWHSEGDIQSANHLLNILLVAEHTPWTNHWISTQEFKLVHGVQSPPNIRLMVSAERVDGPPREDCDYVSTVSTTDEPAHGGYRCPAGKDGGDYVCGPCRVCFIPDPAVHHVDYRRR